MMRPAGPPGHRNGPHYAQDREARRHLAARPGTRCSGRFKEAERRDSPRRRQGDDEVASCRRRGARRVVRDDEGIDSRARPLVEREEAEGLPVPIVPGTRVTEAQAVPPAPPQRRDQATVGTVVGAARRRRPLPSIVEAAENPDARADRSRQPPSGPPTQARADLRRNDHRLARSRCSQLVVPAGATARLDHPRDEAGDRRRKSTAPMYITHLKLDTSPEQPCPADRASTTTSWSAAGWSTSVVRWLSS